MVATVRKNGKPKSGHKNPTLMPGIHRFGRSTMYHKKGIWAKKAIKNPKKVQPKKPTVVEKKVGGEKNGGTRKVQLVKSKRYYPTAVGRQRKVVKRNIISKHKLRGSLLPGTICILVAGRHAGRRVVFLKQLKSGLLLVTGPFKLNSVPMRRVNQRYVIATSARIDISKAKIPETFDDSYFRRDKQLTNKTRKEQIGNIFALTKSGYVFQEKRKTDQEIVDKLLITAIKANPEKKALFKYLASPFYLRTGQYPHRMKF